MCLSGLLCPLSLHLKQPTPDDTEEEDDEETEDEDDDDDDENNEESFLEVAAGTASMVCLESAVVSNVAFAIQPLVSDLRFAVVGFSLLLSSLLTDA